MKDAAHAGSHHLDSLSFVKEILEVMIRYGYISKSQVLLGPQPEPPDIAFELIAVLRKFGYIDRSPAKLGPQPEPPDLGCEIVAILHRYGYIKILAPVNKDEQPV